MGPDISFWTGKRVLLTGHTGFKGSWLTLWLHRMEAEVYGISLPPITKPNLFELARVEECTFNNYQDVREALKVRKIVKDSRPEIVFHFAAQPLVRAGYSRPLETYSTNVMGTANLLDAVRYCDSIRVVIVITTDKVYENKEWPYPYRECDSLGGHDPYSSSKAASEIVAAGYRDAFFRQQGVALATARAGNVVGGGDWSEDRLIPDAIRSWQAGEAVQVRRPGAIRPWQHVLEPLYGYLVLAEKIWTSPELAGAYNFGPDPGAAATVREVISMAEKEYPGSRIVWGDGTEGPHEAHWLALETAKIKSLLGIKPKLPLIETIERTVRWYRRLAQGKDARGLCLAEIAEFEAL